MELAPSRARRGTFAESTTAATRAEPSRSFRAWRRVGPNPHSSHSCRARCRLERPRQTHELAPHVSSGVKTCLGPATSAAAVDELQGISKSATSNRELVRDVVEPLPIVNAANGEPPPRFIPPNSCSAEARSGTTGSLSLCEGRGGDMDKESVAALAATLAKHGEKD